MDDHDQPKFFFFFMLFFVCRRFQSRERRRSARKRIIRFAMLNEWNAGDGPGTRIFTARLRFSCFT